MLTSELQGLDMSCYIWTEPGLLLPRVYSLWKQSKAKWLLPLDSHFLQRCKRGIDLTLAKNKVSVFPKKLNYFFK